MRRAVMVLIAITLFVAAPSSPSAAQSVGTPPTQVGLTPGPASMKVTWADPRYDANYISAVKVDARPGPGSCTAPPESGTCTISGLTNGQAYTFAVFAVGTRGWQYDATVAGPAWPCCSIPDPATDVRAEAQQGAAVVSWQPPGNGAAAGPNLTYSVTSLPPSGTCRTAERTCRIDGLTDGTGYVFLVSAANAVGAGAPGQSPLVTPIGPPGAPTSPRVTLLNRGKATVSWLAPVKTGGAVVDRYVAVAQPGGATCTSSGTLSCQVTGLTNGVPYRLSVTAFNTFGAGTASELSPIARPLTGPGPVTRPSVAISGTRAVVRWEPPNSTGGTPVRGYVIRSSPAGAGCQTSGTSCTVTNLRSGTWYNFVIQARNAKGLGLTAQTRSVSTSPASSPPVSPPRPESTKPAAPIS